MKKVLSIAFVFVLALSLVACSGKKPDGVYTAQVDAAYAAEANHGWTDILIVTYKDGVVADALFESYDANGNKKSEATFEEYPMEYSPSEWMPLIGQEIVRAGTAANMDVVAGATSGSASAQKLFEGIEKDGKAGETITVTIPVEG
jgi:major membrane immunogen (membrane-anchored lipoprotein)